MSALPPMRSDDFRRNMPSKSQIDAMSVAQLTDLLKLCGTLSDVVLQTAAWAWAALDRHGVDLSQFLDESPYLFGRVREIAHETLTVEATMKFGGKGHVLDFVRKQPVEVQNKLVEDDRVLFVVEENKQLTERRLHLVTLSREQMKQLVNEKGEIRTPNQQIAYLSPSPAHPEKSKSKREGVVISRGKLCTPLGPVPVEEVIAKLRQMGHLPVN